ncbi:SDR family NAD(P)-dependent oxidoreductase [Amycolatopsis sp. cmx-4-83]|uniref:SDR family NAD(P)-dependent oxidoreductase n=1 Tax=Amycolatopsis sp. cmx-4-83 TaxID=2790940 RepID=UPI0039783C68
MTAGAVVVTGSGSGIGAITAVTLAQRGYPVVASVRSPDRAAELTELSRRAGVTVDVDRLDVTDDAAIPGFIDGVVARHGGLHAIVSNAGVTGIGTFEDEDIASYRRVFDVNVFGPVLLLKTALPHLRAAGGRFVAVGSIAGVVGLPFQESYSGSKFALEGILESYAHVARHVGVSVSIVAPGPVSTDGAQEQDWPRIFAGAGPYEKLLRQYVGNAAAAGFPGLPAIQTAAEVAAAVADVLAADDPPLRYPTSPSARAFLAAKLADVSGDAAAALIAGWLTAESAAE